MSENRTEEGESHGYILSVSLSLACICRLTNIK